MNAYLHEQTEKTEHKTTTGKVKWDERAAHVESVDDPIEPKGDGWILVGSAISELRYSRQYIFWFWRR